jgi:ubiquinone biosynthesis accessory factor UbiJ
MPATPVWLAAVEAWFSRGAQGSSEAAALLERLDRTALRVDILGIASLRADVAAGRLGLSTAASSEDPAATPADARISGSPFALIALARSGSSGGGSTQAPAGTSRATVSGDAEIANLYRQLFAAARPDFEEELSRLVGDLPARRISQFAQRAADWVRRTHRTAGENVAEYLQEESRDLVNGYELDEFLRGVDTARETADRVQARLSRLEQRVKSSS